jgi:hypothetical protein
MGFVWRESSEVKVTDFRMMSDVSCKIVLTHRRYVSSGGSNRSMTWDKTSRSCISCIILTIVLSFFLGVLCVDAKKKMFLYINQCY